MQEDHHNSEIAATDDIVRNLVDLPSLLILSATAEGPRTVRDLSVELNLPIATLYRKVRMLQGSGALSARKIKDPATGKETMIYESAVDGLNIQFTPDAPTFEVGYRASHGEGHGLHRQSQGTTGPA